MKLYRIAAWLIIAQAVFMELAVFALLLVPGALDVDISKSSEYFSFGWAYLQDNLTLFMMLAGVFGCLRLIGAIGLLKNRLWGLALSVIMIIVTLATMILVLPAGVADGVLSGGSLVLILFAYFGKKKITSN